MTGRSYINVGISAAFLILIAAVPLVQTISELARGERVQAMELFSRAATPASLRAYESDLETGSVAAGFLRPWMQYAQFRLLGEAGEKAAVGFDGWYFYKPGMEYITRRPPASQPGDCPNDPLKAILAFRGQLAARGIRLLVMPVPNKESIYPERLTRRAGRDDLVVCGQTRQLLERLRASGVEVLDLFEVFSRAKQDPGEFNARALYLARTAIGHPRESPLRPRLLPIVFGRKAGSGPEPCHTTSGLHRSGGSETWYGCSNRRPSNALSGPRTSHASKSFGATPRRPMPMTRTPRSLSWATVSFASTSRMNRGLLALLHTWPANWASP